jgi:hypothetical protein
VAAAGRGDFSPVDIDFSDEETSPATFCQENFETGTLSGADDTAPNTASW